jgi:hypothetical protein
MQAMKGATGVLGNMNRSMNLPALQRIAMEFEKENDIMDQRQEMMDDAIDDVTGLEDEAEGEEVVNEVLEEIGIDLKNAVGFGALGNMMGDANWCDRWERLQRVCKARLLRKERLHRLLEVEVAIREIMTSKLDWTA